MEGFLPPAPLFLNLFIYFSLDGKVICSHPVWGLWREFGETSRLATGVSAADKRRERQERWRIGGGVEGWI